MFCSPIRSDEMLRSLNKDELITEKICELAAKERPEVSFEDCEVSRFVYPIIRQSPLGISQTNSEIIRQWRHPERPRKQFELLRNQRIQLNRTQSWIVISCKSRRLKNKKPEKLHLERGVGLDLERQTKVSESSSRGRHV
jgi:hypothetical protein